MRIHRLLLTTVAGSAALLGGVMAGDVAVFGVQPAFAANGNGNGNGHDEDRGRGNDEERGNGQDKDRGNGNDEERGNGNGQGHGDEARGNGGGNGNGHNNDETTSLADAGPVIQAGPGNSGEHGLDAKVAGLHAVNANLNAFIHASPNSRVGEIAAYARAVVGGETADAALVTAQETVDGATVALNEANGIHATDVGVLTDQYGYTDTSAAGLEQAKADLLLVDTSQMTPEQLEAHNAEIAAVDAAIASGAEAEAAQVALNQANDDLLAAQQAAAEAEAIALAALDEAANANRLPVDAEVKLYVDAQLEAGGILDYYRSQVPPPAPVAP